MTTTEALPEPVKEVIGAFGSTPICIYPTADYYTATQLTDYAARVSAAKDAAISNLKDALESIALAGMSGCGQESDEAMTEWHARRAWEFISIAARAIEALKESK